jgi:hypothetical protein
MTSDFNKRTKTCWFYFRVEGARKGTRYRFRIVNFEKSDSLFKQGQRVLCYSSASEQWFRVGGSHVSYLPNNIHTLHAASYGAAAAVDEVDCEYKCPQLYTLEYSFEPTRDGDTLYFAPCFPYSVRDNAQHLSSLQVRSDDTARRVLFHALSHGSPDFQGKDHVQISSLCLSPCLIPCELVTITGATLSLKCRPYLNCSRLQPHRLQDRRRHHCSRAPGRTQRVLDHAVRRVLFSAKCCWPLSLVSLFTSVTLHQWPH